MRTLCVEMLPNIEKQATSPIPRSSWQAANLLDLTTEEHGAKPHYSRLLDRNDGVTAQ